MPSRYVDILHLFVTGLTLVGWAVLFYALLVFDAARPEMSTVITNYHQIEVRNFWLIAIYDRLVWLLWICAGLSMLNIVLNRYLTLAGRPNNWASPIILFTVSGIAILVLLIWQPT